MHWEDYKGLRLIPDPMNLLMERQRDRLCESKHDAPMPTLESEQSAVEKRGGGA